MTAEQLDLKDVALFGKGRHLSHNAPRLLTLTDGPPLNAVADFISHTPARTKRGPDARISFDRLAPKGP
jgi:hypothetical protein